MLVPALPFMIAYDLITGNRVHKLKEQLARGSKPSQPARAWAVQKGLAAPARANKGPTKEDWDRFAAWFEYRSSVQSFANDRARDRYLDLHEHNQAQINAYWSKVAEPFEKNEKAAEAWKAPKSLAEVADQSPRGAESISLDDRQHTPGELSRIAPGEISAESAEGNLFFPGNREIFQRKTGRRLSTNGQSLRGIRDLDDFSKSNNREKTGRRLFGNRGRPLFPFLPGFGSFVDPVAQKRAGLLSGDMKN